MGMKKVFVSLGIGVMVVTGLIQSGVIDVDDISTEADLASNTLNDKWGGNISQTQPSVSNGGTSSSSPSVQTTPKSETKVQIGPVGGVIVPGKIQEIKVKKTCTTLIAETTFTPGKETFLNPPLLATVEPGEYLVTAEGSRSQPFFGNGGEIPTYSRIIDTDGNLLDNSDGKITQFIVTSSDGKSLMTFPDKPYGMFLINTGTNKYAAGKSYFFSTKTRISIKMDLNVHQQAKRYTGTGSFDVKLYRCGK